MNKLATNQTINFIPKPLKIIGATVISLNSLWIGWYVLTVIISIFQQDSGLGWVMVLSPAVIIMSIPVFMGFTIMNAIADLNTHMSSQKYWWSVIGYFIAGTVIPHLLVILTVIASVGIANFLLGIIRSIAGA